MTDKSQPASRSRRLSDIVREVKVAAADRDDVVVEMRDADRARLELLAQELQPIVKDVPADDEQFDFALSSGLQPRFWIDAVAHVHMGRDRRTYRFVRDTRLGRSVIVETAEMAKAADAVSRYVAERVVQRQRILEGDFDSLRAHYSDHSEPLRARDTGEAGAQATETAAPPAASDVPFAGPQIAPPAMPQAASPQTAPPADQGRRSRAFLAALIWFFTGCILGGLAIMAAFADRIAN